MSRQRKSNPGRKGKKVRVAFRRNRNRPPRRKDWTRNIASDESAALDAASSERVQAKGDLSRKRTITRHDADADAANLHEGVVVAMRGLFAQVDDGRDVWLCTVRRVLRTRLIREHHPVTTGDRVLFSVARTASGGQRDGVIERVGPRKGVLCRMVRRRRHVVAANVDQAIIVSSAGAPPFKPHLIDRYIVAAHDGGVEPIIGLNKIDLDSGGSARQYLRIYESLGYRTVTTCAVSGAGVARLRRILHARCSVLVGQSGVGKSSLLNAVDPRLRLRTGAVNTDIRKGRHITTTALLIRLDGGGYVVDTPGVRSFDLSAVNLNDIEAHMREFADYIPHCKFPDCTHRHESGCAVKAAATAGQIHADRYDSYVRMYEERLARRR